MNINKREVINNEIGYTWRIAGPSRYLWCPAENNIFHEEELNSNTKEKRIVLAAARPEDIPDRDTNWKIAHFVAVY